MRRPGCCSPSTERELIAASTALPHFASRPDLPPALCPGKQSRCHEMKLSSLAPAQRPPASSWDGRLAAGCRAMVSRAVIPGENLQRLVPRNGLHGESSPTPPALPGVPAPAEQGQDGSELHLGRPGDLRGGGPLRGTGLIRERTATGPAGSRKRNTEPQSHPQAKSKIRYCRDGVGQIGGWLVEAEAQPSAIRVTPTRSGKRAEVVPGEQDPAGQFVGGAGGYGLHQFGDGLGISPMPGCPVAEAS